MNLILYFFTGLLVAIIGALPLGTVNVAVINTTIKENISSALKIVFPAAIGELLLILFAISYFKTIQEFISQNNWLEYIIMLLLFVIGIVLIFGKKNCIKDENGECLVTKNKVRLSKEGIGFLLGLFNPTVLIYWLLVISFLSTKMIQLNLNTDLLLLSAFFFGAFIGKSITLYGYGKCSHILKMKVKGITTTINKVIGSLLLIVVVIQMIKISF
ncbi:MAG: LysE family transporter [Flavobacteriaceae bacterium]|nr:LysE family transporter [Flavobacteriaceae bacterium]